MAIASFALLSFLLSSFTFHASSFSTPFLPSSDWDSLSRHATPKFEPLYPCYQAFFFHFQATSCFVMAMRTYFTAKPLGLTT